MRQYVEHTSSRAEAEALVPIFVWQEGCRGVRVIGDGRNKRHGVQAFFDADGPPDPIDSADEASGWRTVLVPMTLLAVCIRPGENPS